MLVGHLYLVMSRDYIEFALTVGFGPHGTMTAFVVLNSNGIETFGKRCAFMIGAKDSCSGIVCVVKNKAT